MGSSRTSEHPKDLGYKGRAVRRTIDRVTMSSTVKSAFAGTPIQHLQVAAVRVSDSDKAWFMLITSSQGHPPQMGHVLSPSSSQNERYNDAITSQDAEMRVELTERRSGTWSFNKSKVELPLILHDM
jgi:hypothetical protein